MPLISKAFAPDRIFGRHSRRSGGGASDAAHSFGKPQVGAEARGSPPAGPHGFENWTPPKPKRATKRELATMISRMIGTSLFSDTTEFSVTAGSSIRAFSLTWP